MKNEGDVKKAVKEVLNSLSNCWYYMPVQTGYGVQGIPDFICCVNGEFLAIETKFGKNKLTSWQEKQGDGILAANGGFLVINEHNIETIRAVFVLRGAI